MFVLRAEIVTIFGSKMVTICARNTNIYKICKLRMQGYIFRILQHFVQQLSIVLPFKFNDSLL